MGVSKLILVMMERRIMMIMIVRIAIMMVMRMRMMVSTMRMDVAISKGARRITFRIATSV